MSRDLKKTQMVLWAIYVSKNNKYQYYRKYYYINNKKIHFLLNAYHFNSWAKTIKKFNFIVTELKPPYLIVEILQTTYYKQ